LKMKKESEDSNHKIANYVILFFSLIIASFYFIVIEFSTQTLLNMILSSEDVFWMIIYIITSIIAFGILFVFYYIARFLEERHVKNKSNILIKIIFYYIIPIGFYLLFYLILKAERIRADYFIVIVISIIIRQIMEFFFKKVYKKVPENLK